MTKQKQGKPRETSPERVDAGVAYDRETRREIERKAREEAAARPPAGSGSPGSEE